MKRGAEFALKSWELQPATAKEAAVAAAVECIRKMQGEDEEPVDSMVVAKNVQPWVSNSAWNARKKAGRGAHPARARTRVRGTARALTHLAHSSRASARAQARKAQEQRHPWWERR